MTAKHLSESVLLSAEAQLIAAEKAYLLVTTEKKCSVCSRCVGEKAFYIYPNGVVAHAVCVTPQTLSLCPLTNQDFEKTFKG